MVDIRIWELPPKAIPVTSDEIEIQETADGTSKKATLGDVFTALGAAGGGDPDQNLYETFAADSGTPTTANTITDTLTIVGGTNIDTVASTDTITINTTSEPNEFSYKTIVSDAGSAVADTTTDTLSILGGTNITTSVASGGDVLIIDQVGGGAPDQNIYLTVDADSGTPTTANTTTDTLFILGGAGINTVVTSDTVTITATGAAQNLWETIEVDGSQSIIANSTTDTLKILGGAGIDVDVATATDTITITNTAAGGSQFVFTDITTDDTTTVVADDVNDELTITGIQGIVTSGDISTDTVTIGYTEETMKRVINVLDYGVIADGDQSNPTDNTTALQDMLTNNVPDGSTVFFPPGIYMFDQVNFQAKNDITVLGYHAELLGNDTYTTTFYTFKFTLCNNIKVSGFKFNRLRSVNSNENRSGIWGRSTNGLEIFDCDFYDVKQGVLSEELTFSDGAPRDLFIHHCRMSSRVAAIVANTLTMPEYLAVVRWQQNAIISENICTDSRIMISSNRTGAADTGPFPADVSRNIQVTNNVVDGNTNDSTIYFSDGTNGCIATGNTLRQSGKDAIKAIVFSRNVTVANNVIAGSGEFTINSPFAVQFSAVVNGTITGNTIEAPVPSNTQDQSAIGVYGSSNVVISGNEMMSLDTAATNTEHAIVVSTSATSGDADCKNITISNNVIKDFHGNGIWFTNTVSPVQEITDVVVSGNVFVSDDTNREMHNCIFVDVNCKRFDICNNNMRSMSNHGVTLENGADGVEDIWIHHNFISNMANGTRAVFNLNTVSGTAPVRTLVEDNMLEGIGLLFNWQTATDARYVTGRNNRTSNFVNIPLLVPFTAASVSVDNKDVHDKTFTNTSASNIVKFTLPVSQVNKRIAFVRDNATYAIEVAPNGSEYFLGKAAGDIISLVEDGGILKVHCYNAGTWTIVEESGTVEYISQSPSDSPVSTRNYEVRDVIWNDTPTAGGNMGWVCITAGTGSTGTFKEFGVIEA